jgi:tRNA dimethylallyltransferase
VERADGSEARVCVYTPHSLRATTATLLLDAGVDPNAQALHTVGYVEVIAYLHGRIDRATALPRMQQASRQYAKRQFTWFRADERITWVDASAADAIESILELVDTPS